MTTRKFQSSNQKSEHTCGDEELREAVKELLALADDGAFIDLANIEATPISRKLRSIVAQEAA